MASEVAVTVRGVVTVTCGGRVRHARNLVVTTGLLRLVQALAGTASAGSWYVVLGTGSAAPALGDGALGTASSGTWRAVSAASASGATATLETVFPAAAAVGTWTELGLYGGATSTALSGVLVARVLVPWTKTSSQAATVAWSLTLANA